MKTVAFDKQELLLLRSGMRLRIRECKRAQRQSISPSGVKFWMAREFEARAMLAKLR